MHRQGIILDYPLADVVDLSFFGHQNLGFRHWRGHLLGTNTPSSIYGADCQLSHAFREVAPVKREDLLGELVANSCNDKSTNARKKR